MCFKRKEIYMCKILESYKIDIEETNRLYREKEHSNYMERMYCEKIGENNQFVFYTYRTYGDGSGGYILRQMKAKPKKVVYFGKNTMFKSIYKDYLFQVDRNGEIGRFGITARNINTGNLIKFNWLSERPLFFVTPEGYGRYYSQDKVNKILIEGEKLIFKISRTKSNDPDNRYKPDKYDVTADYDLIVENKDGKFIATSVFPFGKTTPSPEYSLYTNTATKVSNDSKSIINEEYIKYIMSNNPRLTKDEVVDFLSVVDIYDKTGSKENALKAYDSFINQLASTKPFHAVMENGFFCGLLGANLSMSNDEVQSLAKKYTPMIIEKLNAQK